MRELKRPREFMPEARSVIMLTLHMWDPTFMLQPACLRGFVRFLGVAVLAVDLF